MENIEEHVLHLNYVTCEFCGRQITKKRLKAHLSALHNVTLAENTLARLHMTADELPKCKFCGHPVFVDHELHETCESPECHQALVHEHKSAQVSAQQRALAMQGKHAFNHDHAVKLNQDRIKNGTHNFLTMSHESRSKAISARNKTLYSQESYIKHYEDFTADYLREHFYDEQGFDYDAAHEYFQCSDIRLLRMIKTWELDKIKPGTRQSLSVTEVPKDIPANYIKCPWCELRTTSASLPKHMRIAHAKTTIDYLVQTLHITEDNIPKCAICGVRPCTGTLKGFNKTCDSEDCKKLMTKLRKSKSTTAMHLKHLADGTHNFLKENREYNEQGQCIMNIKAAHSAVDSGKCTLLHAEHREDMTKDFMVEHFVHDGYFDTEACCNYFKISESYAIKCKNSLEIDTPPQTNARVSQNEIYAFIESIYQGTILQNTRSVIPDLELDIYIPEKHLAIEFDGIIFHATGIDPWGRMREVSSTYHLNKTKLCEEKSITLLHIFETEWLDPVKKEIWKSLITSKLGASERIYARKCTCKPIDNITACQFFSNNHLQGAVNGKYAYGLFYQDCLVAAMSFSKPRFSNEEDFELLRFCNKINTTVIGGASKLLKAFRNDHPGMILSYANRRWSNGHLYEALGFKFDSASRPDYFYFTTSQRILMHRANFQKWKLSSIKGFNFNAELSEFDNMTVNGYMRIYDCGNLKYILA